MALPNYQLRPSKHVERKIFVETFHHLRKVGYDISDYFYTGMGSPYYTDYLLFHRNLYINRMRCFENNTNLKKRMVFNKPLDFIALKNEDINQAVNDLDYRKRYLIWFDYQSMLTTEI